MKLATTLRWLVALAIVSGAASAMAEDMLKLAIGQRGNWENAAPELGTEAGILPQARADAGTALYAGRRRDAAGRDFGQRGYRRRRRDRRSARRLRQGAPVRAIANSMTGADDLFWYVPAASPIRSIKDAAGKTIAYSTNGSSTNLAVLAFIREFGVQAKPVATGGPASTFTQTMSGQVDIGWSSPPFGVEALQQGRIRIIVRESDVPAFRNQTVRLMIANTSNAEQRRDVLERYLQAYRETLDWMYSDPAALKAYAEWVNIPESLAKEVRDQFYPKENLRLDRLSGLDAAMADAVSLKFLAAPITKQQQDELFKYYARGTRSRAARRPMPGARGGTGLPEGNAARHSNDLWTTSGEHLATLKTQCEPARSSGRKSPEESGVRVLFIGDGAVPCGRAEARSAPNLCEITVRPRGRTLKRRGTRRGHITSLP